MKMSLLMVSFALLCTACSTVPFKTAELVSMEHADPKTIYERYGSETPDAFKIINSVIFEYKWTTFSGVGFLSLNAKERTFALSCMNPLGVKLFEVSGDQNGVTTHFALEEFTKKGDLGAAVGDDIRRIYLDLMPAPDAEINRKKKELVFIHRLEKGRMEHVFAGRSPLLIEKDFFENGELIWRASYYEYRRHNGRNYPGGIIFENNRYGYRLIIRLKEILA